MTDSRAGSRCSSSGAIPSLAMCQVSIASPPLRPGGAGDELERGVERVDVDVERHELVHDRRVGVVGGVVTECGELLGQPVELTRGAGDVADLDVVGAELRRGVEQEPSPRVGLGPLGGPGLGEEVGQELDLEVREAGVIEDGAHFPQ